MTSKPSPYQAKITNISNSNDGKWIQTRKIEYQDPAGTPRIWEMAVRSTRTTTTNIDAVSIVTILNSTNHDKEIIIVKQFRPPTEKVVLELPAGLIDPNETIESTAVRELIEETGYHGTFVKQSIVVYSDPGLTNANMVLAYVDVDLNDPKNINPIAQLEDGEFIEVIKLPLHNLLQSLEQLIEKEGCTIDARLYHFAVGLDLAKSVLS
ncbi:NUDIX hydrolase domain-like protein [Scheffersomyces coipomensis]|uniref:NUDIX hydrolase domain-like protein n=1 Tax=Scheffersomyces coipomensis TaxID=1788519 RepID=UPI00315CB956